MSKFYKMVVFFGVVFVSTVNAKTINIASEVSFPPWNDTKDSEFVGYEVDLFPILCAKAQLECEFNGQQFSSIIPSIRFKKYDIIMSGLGITPDRLRVIDFTVPYGKMQAVFITKTGSKLPFCKECGSSLNLEQKNQNQILLNAIKKDLAKKIVAVQKNSLTHNFFKENKDIERSVTLVLTESQDELVDLLEQGKVDIALSVRTYVVDAIKNKSRKLQIIGPNVTGGLMGNGVGIGIRKGDVELKSKLNKAIAELKNEGVLSSLTTKWFGFDMFEK